MTTTTETKRDTLVFIVTGRRRTSKGTTVHSVIGEEDGRYRYFAKRMGAGSIGTRYEVEVEDGGDTAYLTTAKHLGRIDPDDERIGGWVAADEVAGQEEARARVERKAAAVDPLEDLTKRIEAISGTLNRAERRALATRLLEAVWL